uniref:Reverse transcriptase domain-containing protein n=1 Tax=Solanum lycopersicum TaxID=4081 RepID=A0A3Q7EUM4_SOLLC
MDAYFEHVDVHNEAANIRTTPMYLTDTAMLWWRRKKADMQRGVCCIDSLEHFKVELKRQFYPQNVVHEAPKQALQRRQVSDVDEAIVVAESFNDFRAEAAKGRDNRSKNIPPKFDNNNRGRSRRIQTEAATREATLVIHLLISGKIMRTARRVLLIGKKTERYGGCRKAAKEKAATPIGSSAGEQRGQSSGSDKGKNVVVGMFNHMALINHISIAALAAKPASDEPKTACVTRYGVFEWLVMPSRLTNAQATFYTLMNKLFHPYLDQFVVIYLDYIIVYSNSMEDHVDHLCKVFKVLRDNKLYVKREKCSFAKPTVQFLGHSISHVEIRMESNKVDAIKNWEAPTKVPKLRSFLGLANYYRRLIFNYSAIVAPLTDLPKKDRDWNWLEAFQASFERRKAAVTI